MNKPILFLILLGTLLFGCQSKTIQEKSPISIIPQPQKVEAKMGQFILEEFTSIVLPSKSKEWEWVGDYLLNKINTTTDFQLALRDEKGESNITFENSTAINHPEGYELSIDPYEIIIRSQGPHGAFNAVQTLLQLFPKEIFESKKVEKVEWVLPAAHIVDEPRFAYRGLHFDVSRHFFSIAEVKRFIDLLAYHKMNRFHWHLTDDQGWRIEIKKYPKLTSVGAFRNGTLIGHYNDEPHKFDGKRYGGFYTQEEIKEVVAYAQERFVTVIPEIELPGHAQAAITAYPELACTDESLEVLQKWGVSDNVFCPKETTFEFLENVLEEVIGLFPSKYIHIGGDECPKTKWEESAFCKTLMKKENLKDAHELQSYFIKRIEQFVNSKGRSIIGWDEILEGGLAPNATVMSWTGIQGGIDAAKSGHDVIMSPTSNCYLDYYQSDHPDEPLAIGGFIPLKKVYDYEPIPEELNEEEAKHVLGVQGNVWTEYMKTFEKVEYMTYPRACALAEIAWSSKQNQDFSNFVSRLIPHIKRLKVLEVNVANHLYDLVSVIQPENNQVNVAFSALADNAMIYYSLDGSTPTTNSIRYTKPISIKENSTMQAQTFVDGEQAGRPWQQTIQLHKAAGKSITLANQPHPKYSGGGNGSVINGVKGSNDRYGDAEWLGFDGKDFDAIIDLGKPETVNEIHLRFFKGEGQWIYLPKSVKIFSSPDAKTFQQIGIVNLIQGNTKVVEVAVPVKQEEHQYLKILVENYGVIPSGKQGAGQEAWLFVDEVWVE